MVKMAELASELDNKYDGSENIDLSKAMKSDAVGVNGKSRAENIKTSRARFARHIMSARNYMWRYTHSNKPIMADHKRAMDSLNIAYEDLREILHQSMLIDAPTMDDRHKPEWNDLYWALPHNLYQLGDRVMNMIKESPYSTFHQEFDRLRSTRLRWKEAK